MTWVAPVITLSPRDYDAVLFDLDGVLTRTASVHAAAWKRLFDGFLEQRATQAGEPFVPFDIDTDYPRYVDGKSRYDGVAAFLESRGIELPLGAPEDGPDVQSVRVLGTLKDQYFLQHLEQQGVDPYQTPFLPTGDDLGLGTRNSSLLGSARIVSDCYRALARRIGVRPARTSRRLAPYSRHLWCVRTDRIWGEARTNRLRP
jgi:hypothetical protein